MKLRNKKTGEIREAEAREDGIYMYNEYIKQWCKYKLPALAEQWEYYEEPKEYWYLDLDGEINNDEGVYENRIERDMKEIGNYFETEEEAKKAVEKLKAWKRLKDKGFRFTGYLGGDGAEVDRIYAEFPSEGNEEDVVLLFGGEE